MMTTRQVDGLLTTGICTLSPIATNAAWNRGADGDRDPG
jgi:hypothetical protein